MVVFKRISRILFTSSN